MMRSFTLRRKHLHKDERGAALLEFSVILPVLAFLGFGAVEYGNMLYAYHLIENGARDAARYGAGLPQTDLAGNSLVSANNTAMVNIAMRGTADTSGGLRLSWWSSTGTVGVTYQVINNDDGSGNKLYRGPAAITMVTVTADVLYPDLGFLGFLGRSAPTLHASHQERIFGIR